MKILELNLGTIRPLQTDSPKYTAGWYVDSQTGQPVYYDPDTRNFYTLSGGIYLPLGYMNTAPKQVGVTIGDKLKISISFSNNLKQYEYHLFSINASTKTLL